MIRILVGTYTYVYEILLIDKTRVKYNINTYILYRVRIEDRKKSLDNLCGSELNNDRVHMLQLASTATASAAAQKKNNLIIIIKY